VQATPIGESPQTNSGFTTEAQQVLRRAHDIAQRKHAVQLDIEHILLALLTAPDRLIPQLIRQAGSDPRLLQQRLDATLNDRASNPFIQPRDPFAIHISMRAQRVVSEAAAAAADLGADLIDVTHLLLAIIATRNNVVSDLLDELKVDRARWQAALQIKRGNDPAAEAALDAPARYSRQAILPGIGTAGQARIRAGRVAILGLGALGSALAETLARAGVGTLRLADRDVLEAHNLQRQSLYTEADVVAALPKAVAAADRLHAINRQVIIEPQVADVTAETVEAFISGMDVVLDGTDNFAARYLLNDACLRRGLPWIYNGVIGTSGVSLTVRPGLTACLRCLYPDPPPPGSTPTCETAGVLGPAVQTVAAVAAAATLQLLVGADPSRGLLAVDLWDGTFDRIGTAERDPACPACGAQRYDFLRGGALAALQSAQLCGRATVQVRLDGGLTLPTLAARLREAGLGHVHANAHLIRLLIPPHELTLFPDGRVLVKGTDDPAEARSLVARYIGF
jgi:adenylyltransferase/sulfurtransferase